MSPDLGLASSDVAALRALTGCEIRDQFFFLAAVAERTDALAAAVQEVVRERDCIILAARAGLFMDEGRRDQTVAPGRGGQGLRGASGQGHC